MSECDGSCQKGKRKGYFPVVIEFTEGPNLYRSKLIYSANEIPTGVGFKVLATNVEL
jgi:hypothetical protein